MLTYEPFPNYAKLKYENLQIKIENSNTIDNNNKAIYKEYRYRVNVQRYEVVEVICICRKG